MDIKGTSHGVALKTERRRTGETRAQQDNRRRLEATERTGRGRERQIIETYNYTDEHGTLQYQVVRYEPKGFRQRSPDPSSPGDWRWNVKGVRQVPYGLLELIEARPADRVIVITEGEKDCHAARALGFAATCNAGGAGKWPAELTPHFAGADVVLIPDNDEPGRAHVNLVGHSLRSTAKRVRVVTLPGLEPKGDLSDWVAAGGTREQLLALIAVAPDWVPAEPEGPNGKSGDHGGARDPLDDLVEKSKADPGAPFVPEVLAALAGLKTGNRAAFETLRARLKSDTDVRIGEIDKAIGDINGEAKAPYPTQADTLIELSAEAGLFHAPDGTGYADIQVNGHRETWPIRSKGFRRWLARQYFANERSAASSEAMLSALGVIEARAHYDAPERKVFVRVGGIDDKIYVDLADDDWRAVEIDAAGWRLIPEPPVRFRRSAGMKALPAPVCGGSIDQLRPFLNVASENDFVLTVAVLLAALRDRGPYPIVAVTGEQGSAKSTYTSILRALVDPNTAPLRALPREDRDLFISASNAYFLAFDNVSGLPPWISDTLCRIATSGGFGTRQLYSDGDETLFDAQRPVILNGIEDFVERPDLADRCIVQALEIIPDQERQPEQEFWAAFEQERPAILGALFDAMAHGLRELPHVKLKAFPRMADFMLWITACEGSLWRADTFAEAYAHNREAAITKVLEADAVATAVLSFMARRGVWHGTATALLQELGANVPIETRRSKKWPTLAHFLSGRIRRAATFLRKRGIEITFDDREAATRRIIICRVPDWVGQGASSASSASSASPRGDARDAARPTQSTGAEEGSKAPHTPSWGGRI
jgi:hypothetical protein